MNHYIIVRGTDQTIKKVMARDNGVVSVEALRRAFLLEPSLPFCLYQNGIALDCSPEHDSSNTFIYHLPGQWMGAEYELSWNDSMEIDSKNSEEAEKNISLMSKYVYKVDGITACATAVNPTTLATCYHCIRHLIASGPGLDEIQCHREAVITLTNSLNDIKVKAKIAIYSIEKDVAILETFDEAILMDRDDITLTEAWVGQPYYVFGTPISDSGAPLQVITGHISLKLNHSLGMEEISTLHGHGSAGPGASGGPVFARSLKFGKPALIGIVQAGQDIGPNTMLVTFISSNYVKIISSSTLEKIYQKLKDQGPTAFKFVSLY